MSFKDICVGIPTYNGEATLEKTLESLETQSFKNFSVLISDDNSTDSTLEIIKNYCSRNSNFSYSINKTNLGMFANCNKLFLQSNSKYFCWVPQDDLREKEFLKECFISMEKNEKAVLSYAHTGVIYKKNGMLMHINTINSISNSSNNFFRYKNLIKNFHDSIIYGLIRSDDLKKTSLWKNINGSANKLIYELCLLGEFAEIKKTLSYYYGMGLINRYDSKSEFFRSTKRNKKFYEIPYLILFYNQIVDIFKSKNKIFTKLKILNYLLIHFIKVNCSKLIYRVFSNFFFNKFDNYIHKIIIKFIPENSDIIQVVEKKLFNEFYPNHYPYKKIEGIKLIKN